VSLFLALFDDFTFSPISYHHFCMSGLHPLIIGVMKPQIAACIKDVANSYGDVLLRAWKELKKDREISTLQASLEEAIQGLAHDALHASDSQYFRGIRICLGVFHESKRLKDVDAMLLRIYGPILWRSLRCANAIVRAQSTIIFFDAFPLQNADSNAAEADAILQKQFDLLIALLKDGDHRVRAAAASGVCHILSQYWEALPTATTRKILSFVVGTLGFDSTSANVRISVINGLNVVLEQPLSHGVLKGLLPLLAHTIHDDSERVRVAFINLLEKIKGIRGMHFYDIVCVDHLLRRLSQDADKPLVCRAMTKLLLNSFYPQNNGEKGSSIEQTRRCIKFIRENVRAAEAFYSYFHEFCSVGNAAKLSVVLFSLFTHSSTEVERQLYAGNLSDENQRESDKEGGNGKRTRDSGDEDNAKCSKSTKSGPKSSNSLSDPNVRSGILRVIIVCLSSISTKLLLSDCSSSRELIHRYFTPDLVQLVFNTFMGDRYSVEALPLLLKVVALIVMIPRSESDSLSSEIKYLSSEAAINFYIKHWNDKKPLGSEFKVLGHERAFAVVEFLCATHKGREGLEYISKSLVLLLDGNKFQTSQGSFSPSKKLENGRKTKRQQKDFALSHQLAAVSHATGLPFCAAVELLGAFVLSNHPEVRSIVLNPENMNCVANIFSSIKRVCTLSLSEEVRENGKVLDSTSLVQCIHLWASSAIHISATKTSVVSAYETSLFSILLSWISDVVVPKICAIFVDPIVPMASASPVAPPRSKPRLDYTSSPEEGSWNSTGMLAQQYLGTIILVLVDALVLKLEIPDAANSLSMWIKTLDERSEYFCTTMKGVSSPLHQLLPVFSRLLLLLSSKKIKVLGEETKESIVNILMRRTESVSPKNNKDRDFTVLLQMATKNSDSVLLRALVAHIAKGASMREEDDNPEGGIVWTSKSSQKSFDILISSGTEAIIAAENILLEQLASLLTGKKWSGPKSSPLLCATIIEAIFRSTHKKTKDSLKGPLSVFFSQLSREQENKDPINRKVLQVISRIAIV